MSKPTLRHRLQLLVACFVSLALVFDLVPMSPVPSAHALAEDALEVDYGQAFADDEGEDSGQPAVDETSVGDEHKDQDAVPDGGSEESVSGGINDTEEGLQDGELGDDRGDALEAEETETIVRSSAPLADNLLASAATKPFTVYRADNKLGDYDTWAAVFSAMNTAGYKNAPDRIVLNADYEMTSSDVGKVLNNSYRNNGGTYTGSLTIEGNNHTVSRATGVSGDLFTFSIAYWNANTPVLITIQDLTIMGSDAASGSLINRQGTAPLLLSNVTLDGGADAGSAFTMRGDGGAVATTDGGNVTFLGGSITRTADSAGPLVSRTGGAGTLAFIGTGISRGRATGNLIEDAGTGWMAMRSLTLDGTHAGGIECSSSLVYKTSTGALYFGNNNDLTVDEGVSIVGGTTTGDLIYRSGAGAIALTKSELVGPTVDTESSLIRMGAGNFYLTQSTVTRGVDTGIALYKTGTSDTVFTSSTIDGNEVEGAQSLFKITSAHTVKFIDTTVKGHAGAEGTYAADVSISADVDVSGSTTITGNKAGKDAANLHVSDTYTHFDIVGQLKGTVGVSSGSCKPNTNFAYLETGASGIDNLKSDAYGDNLHAVMNGDHPIRWAADDDLSAMFGFPDVSIDTLKTYPSAEDLALLPDGAIAGVGNEDKTNPYMIWKSASYNADDNSMDIVLNYFQKQVALNLDFIFVIDETGTMTDNKTANGYTQSQALWARYAALKASQGVLGLNDEYAEYGANVRCSFISWSDTKLQESEFYNNFSEAENFVKSYTALGGGTNHNVGINAATAKAQKSREDGQKPIVIYLSDYQGMFAIGGGNYLKQENIDALTEAAESVYAFLIYETYDTTEKGRMKLLTDYEYHYYMANKSDPSTLITPFVQIVRDAVAKCGTTTTVDDVLANGVKAGADANGVTSSDTVQDTHSNEAIYATASGTAQWKILDDDEEDNRLNTGAMYGKKINVPLTDDAYSGSMLTNGSCDVLVDGVSKNSVESPLARKDLVIRLREQKLAGEEDVFLSRGEFILTDCNGKSISLTSDKNGKMVVPYESSDDFDGTFPLDASKTYKLEQTSVSDGVYVKPSGYWTLATDAATGKITVTETDPEGYTYQTLPMAAESGALVVENEKPVYKIVLPSESTNVGTYTFKTFKAAVEFANAHKAMGEVDLTIQQLADEYTMEDGDYAVLNRGSGTSTTITTASASDASYPYRGEAGMPGVVVRGYDGNSMLQVKNGSLAFEDIIFDGASDTYASLGTNSTGYGGILNVQDGEITLGANATFRNSRVDTSDGKAEDGGAVYIKKGTLVLDDASKIEDCSATGRGGGVFVNGGARLLMHGSAQITRCASVKQGGGICGASNSYIGLLDKVDGSGNVILPCTAVISDNCTESERGGGIFYSGGMLSGEDASVYIAGGSICDNTAKRGGGIYLTTGSNTTTLVIDGSTCIAQNNANDGAGLYANGDSSGVLRATLGDDVVLARNIASNNGGGAYVNGGNTVALMGTTVSGNQAKNGAGLYIASGITALSGDTSVNTNMASANGGGAYVADGSTLRVSGAVRIEDNTKAGSASNNVYLPGTSGESADSKAMGVLQLAGNLTGSVGVMAESAWHDGFETGGVEEQFAQTQFTNNNYTGYENFFNDRETSMVGRAGSGSNSTNIVWASNVVLRVSQVISGTGANLTRSFSYSLALPEGTESITGTIQNKSANRTEEETYTFDAQHAGFVLYNGESLLITETVPGTTYEIYENDEDVCAAKVTDESLVPANVYGLAVVCTSSTDSLTFEQDATDVRKVSVTPIIGTEASPATITFTNVLPVSEVPATGLDDNVAAWGVLSGVALAGMVGLWGIRRRQAVA